MGYIGLVIISRHTNKQKVVMGLPTIEQFSILLLCFFVILPAIFNDRLNYITSFGLWLPVIIALGYFLFIQHTAIRKNSHKTFLKNHPPPKKKYYTLLKSSCGDAHLCPASCL